jgi:hypothetical protein
MQVIIKQQPAGLGQILAQILRDERLKVLATPQLVHAGRGTLGRSDRSPDALGSVVHDAVVDVVVSNLRE